MTISKFRNQSNSIRQAGTRGIFPAHGCFCVWLLCARCTGRPAASAVYVFPSTVILRPANPGPSCRKRPDRTSEAVAPSGSTPWACMEVAPEVLDASSCLPLAGASCPPQLQGRCAVMQSANETPESRRFSSSPQKLRCPNSGSLCCTPGWRHFSQITNKAQRVWLSMIGFC